MRQAFSTPFIALLTLAFAICIQNVPAPERPDHTRPIPNPSLQESCCKPSRAVIILVMICSADRCQRKHARDWKYL
jgi:hypothetical protein